jgi:hypothetical protein
MDVPPLVALEPAGLHIPPANQAVFAEPDEVVAGDVVVLLRIVGTDALEGAVRL